MKKSVYEREKSLPQQFEHAYNYDAGVIFGFVGPEAEMKPKRIWPTEISAPIGRLI